MHRCGAPLLLLLLACPGGAIAAPCDPDVIEIDRGETRRLVICAGAQPAQTAVAAPAGIAVAYQQSLRHCAAGDRRPGLQLVLVAGDAAQSGHLSISQDGRSPACDPIAVTVPERVRLPDAVLRPRAGPGGDAFALTITAPAGVDLAPSCTRPVLFPAADGLRLGPASDGRPRCGRSTLTVAVKALDSRQQPAKVVVPEVRLPDGRLVEAVTYAAPPPPRWLGAMAEKDARYVEVNGIRTRFFEKGRGPPLLLVHGGQPSSMDGTAWDWQQNFDGLAEHFHVFALDRLGQGYTANPADLDAYADYYRLVVAHVRAFISVMGLERVHLVGHSQGSWPVTRIALDDPGRVASLTLVDGTLVAPARDPGAAIRFYMYLSQDLHPATGETLESARRGMELFSFTHNNLTGQRIERLVTMTRQPKYAEAVAWFARSGMSPAHPVFRALKQELIAELAAGKLAVPVLVVWGNEDPEGSLPSGLELFQLVSASSPRARLHVFGRSGHLPFVEYPKEFNRLLTDFALGTGNTP